MVGGSVPDGAGPILDEKRSTASSRKDPFIAYEEGSRLLLLRIKRHLHPSHHR